VPCERVFSSSKETCRLRRNKLSPGLLEILQLLKYAYKQLRLDFTSHHLAKEEDYLIEGDVSEFSIRELLLKGTIEELQHLLNN
ncbi:hypothetical protein C8J57DRAFT_949368, partial [Mycena rebaudengoi]